jgi:hypothetical protein
MLLYHRKTSGRGRQKLERLAAALSVELADFTAPSPTSPLIQQASSGEDAHATSHLSSDRRTSSRVDQEMPPPRQEEWHRDQRVRG